MHNLIRLILSLSLLFSFSCEKVELEEVTPDKKEFRNSTLRFVVSDENGNDVPDNDGVQNVLLNASQVTDVLYETTAELQSLRSYEKGETIKGIVYSSTRYEDLFCPNNVSLWTYLTSMSDPGSYMYSKDISASPYCIHGYAKSYYGQVCSSFVQYALGIKYNFQIHQMTVWDEFDKILPNTVDSLMLGDILTSEQKGHTRLVTGIKRQGKQVVSITLSEGNSPVAFHANYSNNEVQKQLNEDGYAIYRYRYIGDVKHPAFDFNDISNLMVNKAIMPKRGDKANWRKDEEVIIDFLDIQGYSRYSVYREGRLFTKGFLNKSMESINFGVLPPGDYLMFLTGDSSESEPVYWMVVDYDSSVIPLGDGKVKVFFSSCNATPIWLTWRRPAYSSASNNNMPLWTSIIEERSCLDGFVESELDEFLVKKYGLGSWDFKVAFQTKYGIICGDSMAVVVQ